MNMKEYWKAVHSGANVREYDLKSREIQKSLKYNPDPKATVRHHLLDTPEQIEYNTNHYEMWGHDLDGSFTYGKYMIFVTEEEHHKIHQVCIETRRRMRESALRVWKRKDHIAKMSCIRKGKSPANKGKPMSDEQKKKIGEANKGREVSSVTRLKLSVAAANMWQDPETRAKIISSLKGHKCSDETKKKISIANSGENNYLYGKHMSDEHKAAISRANSGENNPMYGKRGEHSPLFGIKRSDETKQKMSAAQKLLYASGKRKSLKGENNPNYGKHHSEETRAKMKAAVKNRPPTSDETKKKIGDSIRGEKNGRFGKHCSDEYIEKIRSTLNKLNEAKRYLFSVYNGNGGSLSYREFFKAIKSGDITFNFINCYSVKV